MSLAYSSQKSRRPGPEKGPVSSKDKEIKQKVIQLKEIYPTWSDDDLDSLLREVNLDIETAVYRISEGHAEQWVSSSRPKKEKRAGAGGLHQGKDSHGGWDRERGDSTRGARGGRAGRGGRGGLRGTGRGSHRETNGRHTASPAPKSAPEGTALDSWDQQATQDPATSWDTPSVATGDAQASTTSTTAAPDARTNGALVEQIVPAPAPSAAPVQKTPATTKLSWAQIAKRQDKPKPVQSPAPPPPVIVPTTAPEPSPPVQSQEPANDEPKQEETQQVWEEITTVQVPTWDDEPAAQPSVPDVGETWTNPSVDEPKEVIPEPEEPKPEPTPEPEPEPVQAPSPFTVAHLATQQKTDVVPPVKPATPVSYARSVTRTGNRFKTTDQAVVLPSTFGSSIEKLGMQFGSISFGEDAPEPKAPEPTVVQEAPIPAPEPVRETPVVSAPVPVAPAEPEVTSQLPTTTSASHTPLTSSQTLFQQAVSVSPQQQQSTVQPSLTSLQNNTSTSSLLSSQVSQVSPQPSVPSQTTSTATSTPLTSFASQQNTPASFSPYPQHATSQSRAVPPSSQASQSTQSHLQQQFQQYPSQLDATGATASPASQQSSIHQGLGGHNSYFRQPGQEYSYSATPPAGPATDSPYGSFAPLSSQLGHSAQGSHLGGFNSDHFGYNDNQRGFYDSYGQQQSGFGGRNALGHDDVGKGLPSGQQASQGSNGLPQSTSNVSSQQASQQGQNSSQPSAPSAGQPQQGFPPVPYFYNPYTASQFYGPPFASGYNLGQYGNRYSQPPMFTPPNPTSGTPANAKGPNLGQPQYAQNLYGQHASPGYDDAYHNQLGHGHAQNLGGLPGGDYTKQLYGGQGVPGFAAGGPGGAPGLGQRGAGAGGNASPENAYKPYAASAKDPSNATGVNAGMGTSSQGGLSAASAGTGARGAGVQQPQGFYGANRFAGTPGTGGAGGPGGPGQQGHGQQAGTTGQVGNYPQGGSVSADSAFYYNRGPGQQQQFWQ